MNIEQHINDLYKSYTDVVYNIEKAHRKGWFCSQILTIPYRIAKRLYKRQILSVVQSYHDVEPLDKLSEAPIISLTSFPKRIDIIHIAIESIFRQTIKPSRIILWLSKEEFPQEAKTLPQNLLRLKEFGLEICFVEGNLKAHKKYFYTLKNENDKCVITIDDDLYYPIDTIERLINLHKKYPSCVCANITRCININSDNQFSTYKSWKKESGIFHSVNKKNVAIGMGGVLYPNDFRPDGIFDIDNIISKCPLADDLWLKAHETKCGVNVASGISFFPHPIELPNTIENGLQKQNMSNNNLNDSQWQNVTNFLSLKTINFE